MELLVRGRTRFILLATMVVAVAATAGYALWPDRAPDCAGITNEPAILDELAKDPALAVTPPGASRRSEPRRQPACQPLGRNVTTTSVSVEYELPRALPEAEVRALYEPVAAKVGWVPMPGQSGHGGDLHYCRSILDQPAMLSVHWHDPTTIDSGATRQHIPGLLFVGVFLWTQHGDGTDTEPSRVAAGCQYLKP